ncbi:hypothetical protein F5Y14DRAFT_47530 [Nemania sp. NC0429]|nr:hypothetical protein F5Y14DRAFT_47530 [Nemania sp. NC0429]
MTIYDVVLDPDGDILVIVPGTSLEDVWKYFVAPDPAPKRNRNGNGNGSNEPEPEAQAEAPSEEEAVAAETMSNGGEPPPSVPAPAPSGEDRWRFRASSKHLTLASTYVKRMLSGPWREANEVHEDGLLHWKLDGFDMDAIATVLCIIHGLNRQVERTITLSRLAQVSRVVDYLGCHEAVELYASIWLGYLSGLPANKSSHADWDSWISATGVFQNPDIFKKWTRVAIVEKLNAPPSLELPLLSQAYDAIDERRQLHLDKIISCVYSHVDRLSKEKTCSAECDAMLLGTLLRHLHANSLSCLRPARPYEGLSIGSVVKAVRGLSVPEWYAKVHPAEEPTPNPFEFWGAASRKASKVQSKKVKTKSKKKTPSDEWGAGVVYEPPREVEEMEDVVVNEHSCGFDELIAAVNGLEAEIRGLDLADDLGIRW